MFYFVLFVSLTIDSFFVCLDLFTKTSWQLTYLDSWRTFRKTCFVIIFSNASNVCYGNCLCSYHHITIATEYHDKLYENIFRFHWILELSVSKKNIIIVCLMCLNAMFFEKKLYDVTFRGISIHCNGIRTFVYLSAELSILPFRILHNQFPYSCMSYCQDIALCVT